jgi:hypothetical protein
MPVWHGGHRKQPKVNRRSGRVIGKAIKPLSNLVAASQLRVVEEAPGHRRLSHIADNGQGKSRPVNITYI